MNDVTSDGYTGRANETTGADEFNAQTFLINQVLSGKWTITLCVVKSVAGGGVNAPPIVSVQPLVNQVDGQGTPTPHGIINGVPVFRLQGGASAFIADPVAGDIGLLASASRDISAVKNNKAASNPGSQRMFDPADSLYLGSFLSAAPTQYVQITPDGINIVFPGGISIKISSSGITLAVGGMSIVISSSGVTIAGIDFASHVHTGVTTGGADSGPPLA
jgi:hypothetical protein